MKLVSKLLLMFGILTALLGSQIQMGKLSTQVATLERIAADQQKSINSQIEFDQRITSFGEVLAQKMLKQGPFPATFDTIDPLTGCQTINGGPVVCP